MYRSNNYKKRSKKNKTYGGFKGKSVKGDYNTNWTKRQLNVYLHPFSVSTVAAKIPDGKVTISCAQRRQLLTPITTAGAGVEGTLWLLLHGSINSSLMWITGPPNALVGGWNLASFDDAPVAGVVDNVLIKEFRIVSAGLKIQLHNNSDQNNGFWEAIRVPTSSQAMNIMQDETTTYIESIGANLIDHPSYCTGRLKDIHKYVFQTKPDGNSHNLMQWGGQGNIDTNQDAVLIKIVGRSSILDADSTKINVHSVSNQEVCFAPTSIFHRFQTESTYDSRFDVAVHANSVNLKAATRAYVNA